jgi:Outer membrane protein beta-barrel domain
MRRVLPILALLFAAGAAHAADDLTVYLGAGISRDKLSDIQITNSDLNSTSWKALVGVRPLSVFAVEADYIDLGSQTFSNDEVVNTGVHVSYKAFAGYAVGFVPLAIKYVDVFGKLGFARWSLSGSSSAGGNLFSLSDNGTELAWGVGAQAHLGNVGGRLEYEDFHIRNTSGAGIFSASVFLNLF